MFIWEGAQESVQFIQEAAKWTWGTIENNNIQFRRVRYSNSMEFKGGGSESRGDRISRRKI